MCQLLETIKVKNRQLQNVKYHNERLNRSRNKFFGRKDIIDLDRAVKIPQGLSSDEYKCRVIYRSDIISVNYELYRPRVIKSLKLVECNKIDYRFKLADRSVFDKLLNKKAGCDEILIVNNGFVTDTSFSNIVFFDGKDWITPSTPLLKGTKRAKLLNEGIIKEAPVKIKELHNFQYIKLINAMLDLDEGDMIEVNRIME